MDAQDLAYAAVERAWAEVRELEVVGTFAQYADALDRLAEACDAFEAAPLNEVAC